MDTAQIREQLEHVWRERTDDQVSEGIAKIGDFDKRTQDVIVAEAKKRFRNCPKCALTTPLTTQKCDCGHRFVLPIRPQLGRDHVPPAYQSTTEYVLWVLGAYFAWFTFRGELRFDLERHDTEAVVAAILLPTVVLGLAGFLRFRIGRWIGVKKSAQWLAFAPMLWAIVLAAIICCQHWLRQSA
jgi:hypothetical protein